MRILVTDDEQDLCEILQFNLQTEGYDVLTANSAEEALNIMKTTEVSLLILDVMMEGMTGFELAQKMKQSPELKSIPIIFTTALDSEANIVKGLNLGADDYMVKPLSMKELKARVKAVLRRTGAHDTILDARQCVSTKDGLKIDNLSKTVVMDGERLNLSKLEYELLALFLQNRGKVFSREDLIEHCWPKDGYVLDRSVDVCITRLRKKIGRYGSMIKTRTGYGYVYEE